MVARQRLIERGELLLVDQHGGIGLALLGRGLLHELGLVHDRCLVRGEGLVGILDDLLIGLLGVLLGRQQLRLVRVRVLPDLLEHLDDAAAATALLELVGLLGRRSHGGAGLVAGGLLLAHLDLGQGLGVELVEAVDGLAQDVDGATLVRDRLLEDQVLGLAVLTRALEGDVHVRNLLAEGLQVGLQRLDAVFEAQLLALEVFLLVLLHRDVVFGVDDVGMAIVLLLNLGLLLCLELLSHLVQRFLDLFECVQAHSHAERGQDPVVVLPGDLHDVPHGLVEGFAARGIGGGGRLHEGHGLAEQVTSVVLREDCDGLADGHKLLVADLLSPDVVVVVGLAILLEAKDELLVESKGSFCRLQVLLGLCRLALNVCQGRLLLLFRHRGRLDLAGLRGPEALEGDQCLHLLFLRHDQVFDELILHLAEHAEDPAAAGAIRARTCCGALQARRVGDAQRALALEGGQPAAAAEGRSLLVDACGVANRTHDVPQVTAHHVLEAGLVVDALEGTADLHQHGPHFANGRVAPLLLQQLHLGQDVHGLPHGADALLGVGLGGAELLALLLTECRGGAEGLLVSRDVLFEGGDFGLELGLGADGLLQKGLELDDALLGSLNGLSLQTPIRSAPAVVLVVRVLVRLRILLHLRIHLLQQAYNLFHWCLRRGGMASK
mmetsp:Transcript_22270/g.62472  ORF Transcript_22270/g.62472 Transcript_22270/m.62472 type:complete len:665 (-) Transcript_22270:93-2087(-)